MIAFSRRAFLRLVGAVTLALAWPVPKRVAAAPATPQCRGLCFPLTFPITFDAPTRQERQWLPRVSRAS